MANGEFLKGGLFGAMLVIISVVFSVGVNYGAFATRLSNLESEVAQVQPNNIKLEVLSSQLTEVNRRLGEIERKLNVPR